MNPSDVRLDELGFPIPRTFDDLAPAAPTPRARRGVFLVRGLLVVVAVCAGVMALVRAELGKATIGNAIAQWLMQHAEEKFAVDDLPGAERDLDRAVAWSDRSPPVFALRGMVREKRGDLSGSLADYNKLVGLTPNFSRAYLLRSRVLQRLERHEDAIRDASQAVQLRRSADPALLNARAYTRAIAGQELDEALEDVEQALRMDRDNADYLDTRGYLQYLKGNFDAALRDLDDALELSRESPVPDFLVGGGGPQRRRMLARLKLEYEHSLAVMYHHRGQVYEKLGRTELAEIDLRRGDELGYNPAAGVY